MTFNVRGAVIPDGENVWPKRAALNLETIRRCEPDIIGFQEAQQGNLDTYQALLDAGYAMERGPRYNNREPHCYPALFWKEERFTKADAGGFWLSTTPDLFSGSWATDCIRSACWVHLRARDGSGEAILLNTHLDHISEEARVKGSALIVERFGSIGRNLPVVAMGDFNANPETDTYRNFREAGFRDTFLEAGHRDGEDVITFHAFTGAKQGWERRIDWIFLRDVASRPVGVRSCQIITDAAPPLYPSDHYPVVAEIEMHPAQS
jgi:endonuclease/exonuclease/phosphatase family metal-dependent hydrolase